MTFEESKILKVHKMINYYIEEAKKLLQNKLSSKNKKFGFSFVVAQT